MVSLGAIGKLESVHCLMRGRKIIYISMVVYLNCEQRCKIDLFLFFNSIEFYSASVFDRSECVAQHHITLHQINIVVGLTVYLSWFLDCVFLSLIHVSVAG